MVTKVSVLPPTTEEEVSRIIKSSSTKSCGSDPIPTQLLKASLNELLPIITFMANLSMSSGVMPHDLKIAIILPYLKKVLLDPEVFKHFRPVSNLPFVYNIIEKVVAVRYKDHIVLNKLDEPFQSAYKEFHSTETALVRVNNDLMISLDEYYAVALILIDLSAVFDTVDQSLLLEIINICLGIDGTALKWFKSYLTDRSQYVFIEGARSRSHTLTYGVPQGSVLGPLLFSAYLLPLGDIIRKHDLDFHLFADDSQLYICFRPHFRESVSIT